MVFFLSRTVIGPTPHLVHGTKTVR
jgi:hypothetical protein